MEKKFYKTGEVASILGVHAWTVAQWIKRGKLRALRTPGGRYLVPREELERLLRGEVK